MNSHRQWLSALNGIFDTGPDLDTTSADTVSIGRRRARDRIPRIGETLLKVFEYSYAHHVSLGRAAERLAIERLVRERSSRSLARSVTGLHLRATTSPAKTLGFFVRAFRVALSIDASPKPAA